MSIRFTDDLKLRAPAAPAPIHTVSALRKHLALNGASADAVVDAIRRWLTEHEASSTLLTSIARSPYAAALPPGSRTPIG